MFYHFPKYIEMFKFTFFLSCKYYRGCYMMIKYFLKLNEERERKKSEENNKNFNLQMEDGKFESRESIRRAE